MDVKAEIPTDTLDALRDIQRQKQQLRELEHARLHTLLDAKGLDPSDHEANLEAGVICKQESSDDPE